MCDMILLAFYFISKFVMLDFMRFFHLDKVIFAKSHKIITNLLQNTVLI